MRALVVRKTRTSLSESGMVTFEDHVLGADHPMVVDGPQRPWRSSYVYPNGSQIVLGGMDKPGRVLSSEYDIIYVQQAEEVAEEDWETLLTRLRGQTLPYRQIMACCNPDRPSHWLKGRCDAGTAKLLDSKHEENPVLYDLLARVWTAAGVEYIAKLDALTGARKQRLRYGKWVQAEGVVYEEWNSALHLIDPFPIPADWRRFRAVDFGYTNPFVCHWWAVDGDGRLYLYREIYHTGRTVKVHSDRIKALTGEEQIEATICDHDAEDRATLRENGISSQAADKAVSVGIQKVQERLKVAGDGRPRLFVFRDCVVEIDSALVEAKRPVCTAQEFDGYVWSDKATKEAPVKVDDHGMDTLRYAVMHVDAGRTFSIGFA